MTSDWGEPPSREGLELLGAHQGIVYIFEDRVALDIRNFGRVEFAPDVAETVAKALLQGVRLLREGNAQDGRNLL